MGTYIVYISCLYLPFLFLTAFGASTVAVLRCFNCSLCCRLSGFQHCSKFKYFLLISTYIFIASIFTLRTIKPKTLIIFLVQTVGSFATLMKVGRQGLSQGKFALAASIARIVFPMLSEMLEQYFQVDASFSVCLLLIAAAALWVLFLYAPLAKYTDRNAATFGTPTGLPAVLGKSKVRNVLIALCSLMLLLGCLSLTQPAWFFL